MPGIVVVLLLAMVVYARSDFPRAGETLYVDAEVVTMDPDGPVADAVLVRDGRIVAVGDEATVRSAASPGATVVDLAGATMLPGFIDAHSHVDISAFLSGMVDLSGFTNSTDAQVWQALRSAVDAAEPGTWVAARGLDPILVPDLKSPTIADLDRIAPDNPVVILSQTLHTYWANSAAFAAVGITRDTPDPSTGSFYERDAGGDLTGRIIEQAAFEPLKQGLLDATPKSQMLAGFDRTMRAYAANGNTTVVSAGLSSDQGILFRLQQYLAEQDPDPVGKALAAVRLFPQRTPLPRHFLYIRPEMAEQFLPDGPDNGDDFFRVIGVKLWYDGSPYTGSMYLSAPYLVSPLSEEELHIHAGDTGEPLISVPELTAAIEKYNGQGWQVIVHAQGDQAIADTVAAFEAAAATVDVTGHRDRVEHGLLLDPGLLERMWALGVSPSYHINHIYYYGEALRDSIIGPERAQAALPVRTSADLGQPFSLHADQPMFDSDPLSLVATAVSRTTRDGAVLGADQAITVEQALRAVTTMAAWQIGMEDDLGSITPGKYADLVVLDRNPLTTPVEQLRDIEVLRTVVAGNEVPLAG